MRSTKSRVLRQVRAMLELDVAHGLNCEDFTAYAAALARWPRNYFDVIVVDGMARSLCAYMAGLWVKDDGIVIFDDAGRREYAPGYQALDEMGFGRIDFFGPGPLDTYEWCTSLFVKSLNHFRGTAHEKKSLWMSTRIDLALV